MAAAAPQAGGGAGRAAVPDADPGHPRRRPAEQRRLPVHAAGATARRCCTNGRRSCWPRWNTTRCCATSIPTSSRRAWRPTCRSTAPPPAGWASTPARSTTRCMTRSASARSRPSTARRTSTMSSWRWRRATGRRRQTLKDIYVSTAGGTASGTETTNAVIGTVTGSTTAGCRREHPVDQSAGQHQQHDQQRQQHDQQR